MTDSALDDDADGEADIDVSLDVTGVTPDVDQRRVLDLYETNAATFIRKNEDYGSSFVKSGMIASIYETGEVDPDVVIEHIARQISVRMQDKQARLYQTLLADDHDRRVADESTIDTLLDLGNYAIMLASQLVKYHEGGFKGQHPELETLNELTSADDRTLRETIEQVDKVSNDTTIEIDGTEHTVSERHMTPAELLEAVGFDAGKTALLDAETGDRIPDHVTLDLVSTDTFKVTSSRPSKLSGSQLTSPVSQGTPGSQGTPPGSQETQLGIQGTLDDAEVSDALDRLEQLFEADPGAD